MRSLLILLLFAFLFLTEISSAQSLLHSNNGKTLTPAILDGVDKKALSLNITKLNGKMISDTFRMPVFNPKGVDAKILTVRASGEYRYGMPNLLPKNGIVDTFQFYRDRKKE